MTIQTCRVCKGRLTPVPGHPPGIHPMCAPEGENWHSRRDWQQMVEQLDAVDAMPLATIVIACGGREYDDEVQVRRFLADLNRNAVLRHGGASGADELCGKVWTAMGGVVEVFEADWGGQCSLSCPRGHRRPWKSGTTWCPAAGPRRNRRMARPKYAEPAQLVVAFPGGKGTADMISVGRAAGIPVRLVPHRIVAPKRASKQEPGRRAA